MKELLKIMGLALAAMIIIALGGISGIVTKCSYCPTHWIIANNNYYVGSIVCNYMC